MTSVNAAGSTPHVAQTDNILVLKKALDHQRAQGEASVGLIEAAGQVQRPNSATPIAPRAEPGRLDVYV